MLNPTVYLAPRHAAFLALLVAACAPYPQRVHQEPVIAQGERIPAA
jgi:hypothetical protein